MEYQFFKSKICGYISLLFIMIINTNLYCQEYFVPKRPRLGDSINFPVFIGGYTLIKDTILSDLNNIYKHKQKENYTRIHFVIDIDEQGKARENEIVFVTRNLKKGFNKFYYNMLIKIQNWKPATRKKDDKPVPYIINIEIESRGKLRKISVYNTDYQRMFEDDL